MKTQGGNAARSLCSRRKAEAARERKAKALLQQPDEEMPARHAIRRGSDTPRSSRTPAPWASSISSASWDEAMSHGGVPGPALPLLRTPPAWHGSPGAPEQHDGRFPPASSKGLLKSPAVSPWQGSASFQARFCTRVLFCFTYTDLDRACVARASPPAQAACGQCRGGIAPMEAHLAPSALGGDARTFRRRFWDCETRPHQQNERVHGDVTLP